MKYWAYHRNIIISMETTIQFGTQETGDGDAGQSPDICRE